MASMNHKHQQQQQQLQSQQERELNSLKTQLTIAKAAEQQKTQTKRLDGFKQRKDMMQAEIEFFKNKKKHFFRPKSLITKHKQKYFG